MLALVNVTLEKQALPTIFKQMLDTTGTISELYLMSLPKLFPKMLTNSYSFEEIRLKVAHASFKTEPLCHQTIFMQCYLKPDM